MRVVFVAALVSAVTIAVLNRPDASVAGADPGAVETSVLPPQDRF